MEIWKDIEGFEGCYQVSNYGRIRSLRNQRGIRKVPKILKPEIMKKGYLRIPLRKNYCQKHVMVHRLVAIAFVPNPLSLPYVNHKDEDKSNNLASNLEWCTNEYNENYGTRNLRTGLSRRKPIVVYDAKGNFIAEYPSINDAAAFYGINASRLAYYCRGLSGTKREELKGLRFEFKNEKDSVSRIHK
jgi:hypothetical protein